MTKFNVQLGVDGRGGDSGRDLDADEQVALSPPTCLVADVLSPLDTGVTTGLSLRLCSISAMCCSDDIGRSNSDGRSVSSVDGLSTFADILLSILLCLVSSLFIRFTETRSLAMANIIVYYFLKRKYIQIDPIHH